MTTDLVPPEQTGIPHGPGETVQAVGFHAARKSHVSADSSRVVYHGWVCSGPYFETVMYVYCAERGGALRKGSQGDSPLSPDLAAFGRGTPIEFELFDPDGFCCNRVELQVEPGKVAAIDWDPFLGNCKFEAGMKHGHVVAKLPPGFRAVSRLVSSHAGCFFGRPLMLTASSRAFAPITLSRDRFPMVVLVNHSAVEATVRGRLFCGKRTPENVWQVPANGTRVLSIAHEFGDAITIEPDEQVQTYLRMGVRGEYEVGVQCIERLQGPNESSVYLALG
jgi:hypothetical protein